MGGSTRFFWVQGLGSSEYLHSVMLFVSGVPRAKSTPPSIFVNDLHTMQSTTMVPWLPYIRPYRTSKVTAASGSDDVCKYSTAHVLETL